MLWPGVKAGVAVSKIGAIGTQPVGAESTGRPVIGLRQSVGVADIRANSVLPAHREAVTLQTSDGLTLVGELATPLDVPPVATIVMVHPLPTHGGMMDSHLFRKAAWRLPALAEIAVLRFNTRGTSSAAGASQGTFDEGDAEGLDLSAAVDLVASQPLPMPWLVGWSFGTDVILKHPEVEPVRGAVLISPPRHYSTSADLQRWALTQRRVVALIPELDDYLRPEQASAAFAELPTATLIQGSGANHLWVGEPSTRFVLDEIVRAVSPHYFDRNPNGLPAQWEGPMQRWTDL